MIRNAPTLPVLERPWTRQPQGPLNRQSLNPALSITAAVVGSSFGRTVGFDEAQVVPAGITSGVGLAGRVYSTSDTTSERVTLAADADSILGTDEQTFAFYRRCRDTSARISGAMGYDNGSSEIVQAVLGFTDGFAYFDYGNTGTGRLATVYSKDTEWETIVLIAHPTRGREFWRRGVLINSDTGKNASRTATTSSFAAFGRFGGSVSSDAVDYALFIVGSKAWTPSQIRAWCDNPYKETFAPRRIWIPTAAAGNAYPDGKIVTRDIPWPQSQTNVLNDAPVDKGHVWTRQPQQPAAAAKWLPGNTLVGTGNFVSGAYSYVKGGTNTVTVGAAGTALTATGTSVGDVVRHNITPTRFFTVVAVVSFNAAGTIASPIDSDTSTSRIFQFRKNTANSFECIFFNDGGSPFTIASAAAIPTNRPVVLVMRAAGATGSIFYNNEKVSTTITGTPASYSGLVSLCAAWAGSVAPDFNDLNGQLFGYAVIPAALTDDRIRSIQQNPWQLFAAPKQRQLWATSGVSEVSKVWPEATTDVLDTAPVVSNSKKVWTRQPQGAAQVKPGALVVATPNHASGATTAITNAALTVGALGRAWNFTASDQYVTVSGFSNWTTGGFDIVIVGKIDSPTNYQTLFQNLGTGGLNNRIDIYTRNTGIRADIFNPAGSAAVTVDTTTTLVAGQPFVYVLRCAAGTVTAYLDGGATSGAAATIPTDTASSYTIGGRTNNTEGFSGLIFGHALLKAGAFDPISVCRSPWQLFAPRRINNIQNTKTISLGQPSIAPKQPVSVKESRFAATGTKEIVRVAAPYVGKNKPWTRQPQVFTQINWSNPLTGGLVSLVGGEGGDYVPGSTAKVVGVGLTTTTKGKARTTNESWNYNYRTPSRYITVPQFTSGSPRTVLLVAVRKTYPWANGTIVWGSGHNGSYNMCVVGFGLSGISFDQQPSGVENFICSGNGKTLANPGQYNPTSLVVADGEVASFALATQSMHSVGSEGNTYLASMRNDGGAYEDSDVGLLLGAQWNRKLTQEELNLVTGNPWQLFQQQPTQKIWVPT